MAINTWPLYVLFLYVLTVVNEFEYTSFSRKCVHIKSKNTVTLISFQLRFQIYAIIMGIDGDFDLSHTVHDPKLT